MEGIKDKIKGSILCWMATADLQGHPNVSPKEMFIVLDDKSIIIANIASPNTVRNVEFNPSVCISMVNIFTQKGEQLKGKAEILKAGDTDFIAYRTALYEKFGERFKINSLFHVTIESTKSILAPSYVFFPEETTEEAQIKGALETYMVRDLL